MASIDLELGTSSDDFTETQDDYTDSERRTLIINDTTDDVFVYPDESTTSVKRRPVVRTEDPADSSDDLEISFSRRLAIPDGISARDRIRNRRLLEPEEVSEARGKLKQTTFVAKWAERLIGANISENRRKLASLVADYDANTGLDIILTENLLDPLIECFQAEEMPSVDIRLEQFASSAGKEALKVVRGNKRLEEEIKKHHRGYLVTSRVLRVMSPNEINSPSEKVDNVQRLRDIKRTFDKSGDVEMFRSFLRRLKDGLNRYTEVGQSGKKRIDAESEEVVNNIKKLLSSQ